jgi:hypothetical protein
MCKDKCKYGLAAATAVLAFAAAAPVAFAQTTAPLNAAYTLKAQGPGPSQRCADGAFACGTGTDASFGSFSYEFDFTDQGIMSTLTFSTGTLVLDETFQSITQPGQSGLSNQPNHALGHPSTVEFTWSVDPASSGSFAGATGTGTDVQDAAGSEGDGILAGTINLP